MGEEIGVGGMGRVYKAHHRELGKPAAVKLLTESIFSTRAALLRFASEAKICSDLKHPNIVEIFDYDVDSAQPYIVFEFVEGRDLSVMIDDGMAVPLTDLLEMVAQVADALHYAHSHQIIHRDVKPDNILVLPDNRIKVMDFGIAKRGDVSTVKTRTGVILGTPRYMSPEQAQAQKLTPATDIYSLGVVLFEVVAGVRPFEAPSDLEVLLKHLHEAPPRAAELNTELPPSLDALINRCLVKDPRERPSSAKAVASKLRQSIDELSQARSLTVTLGCRIGSLESPFDKNLARSSKKPIPKAKKGGRSANADYGHKTRPLGSAVSDRSLGGGAPPEQFNDNGGDDSQLGAAGRDRRSARGDGGAAGRDRRSARGDGGAAGGNRRNARGDGGAAGGSARAGRGARAQGRQRLDKASAIDQAKALISKTKPSTIRRFLKFAWLPLAFCALLAFFLSSTKNKESKVAKVSVDAVSSNGAVITWQSDWHTSSPLVQVTNSVKAATVSFDILASEVKKLASSKELPYSYSLALGGLEANENYAVTVPKPDGSTSFAKSFKTKIKGPTDLDWYVEFKGSKEWLFLLRAKVPFNVTKATSLTLVEPKKLLTTKFDEKYIYNLSEESIKSNAPINISILTLNGEKQELKFNVLDGLSQQCNKLYEAYYDDYQTGNFWRAFTGKSGTPVRFFYEIGGDLNPQKEVIPPSWFASTWKTIDRRLDHCGRWYKKVSALAPGVQELTILTPLDHPLRWSCWQAMVPLILTQCAAGMRKLTPHPHWGPAVLPERQPDISIGRPHIANPSFSKDFLEPSLIEMEQYPFVDTNHPQANKMTISKEAEAVLLTRQRTLSLEGFALSKYKEAELEVFINDGAMHRIFLVDLNDGKFKSVLQTPKKDSEIWEQSLQTENYARLGMMMFSGLGTEKLSAKDTMEQLNTIAHPIDGNPSYRRKYYLRVPISALKENENTFRITIMNTPSYYTALSFYVGTKLRLR